VARGARGIKLAHAYWRTLHCEPVSAAAAGRALGKALRGRKLSADEVKRLQDHVIFFLAGLAADLGIVFQIHTGVQGNWGHVPDSNPMGLLALVRAHPGVRFDLFHAGYPYSRELGMMGKHYRNVWLNMCWMYVITMAGSRQVLSEWIDLVPGHRLLGFGSDVGFPELVYGHLLMARSCLADVLADKVARDFLSEAAALDLVRMMLHDNAVELYGLGE
jgi:predicted TIM-barrel fold metal-dependent hydrolase